MEISVHISRKWMDQVSRFIRHHVAILVVQVSELAQPHLLKCAFLQRQKRGECRILFYYLMVEFVSTSLKVRSKENVPRRLLRIFLQMESRLPKSQVGDLRMVMLIPKSCAPKMAIT
ncbi:MAG: hypothetical protein EBY94_08070 [Burkholderiaceae bacterium]|nr:hypothetical protein [Burkholderiaceae bacterium]